MLVIKGGSYWDKNLVNVAICIQVSIENYQWCFSCVTDPSPPHDATSVERPGWLQATSCLSVTPAMPNLGATMVLILAYQSHMRASTQGSGFIGCNTRLCVINFLIW